MVPGAQRHGGTDHAMTTPDFFPYHPLRLRLLLLGTSVVCVALLAWAVTSAAVGGQPLEWARAGLCLGLLLAMMYVWQKLAPRTGWGVTLKPTMLVVSKPIQGDIEIAWSAVKDVRRIGKGRDTLVLLMSEDKRVLVPRHLFASSTLFEALARAIDERLPSAKHDA